MSIEITTRREMATVLDAVMNSSYGDLIEELRLQRGHSLLKTYLLEAHMSANATHGELLSLLRHSFSESRRKASLAEVSETREEKLFRVRGTNRSDEFMFYIDAADSRFWVAHSLAKSEVSDREIDVLLSANRSLDCTWMPTELLTRIQSLGESKGLGLDFDRRYMDSALPKRSRKIIANQGDEPTLDALRITNAAHFEYVKMQLWGSGAERIMNALSQAGLGNSTTISKVRLKSSQQGQPDFFSLSDVKFDGKITGRGTSFDVYNGLLGEIMRRYSTAVRETESKYRIAWNATNIGSRLAGEPLYLRLGDGLKDLEGFCLKLFSGGEPFRLAGRPVRRNSNFFTVSAIDLHVNQRIDFEISCSTLTIFLPQMTCGNSILRLYTNLQHYLSSDVKAIDGAGARVFAFQS